MMFCGGVPLLLPIAAVGFALMYKLDKFLLLRFYRRPPQYDASLGEHAASLLPWALVLHLLFSTWMYGDARPAKGGSDFGYNVHDPKLHLPSARVSTDLLGSVASSSDKVAAQEAYDRLLETAREHDPLGENGLIPKIVRVNCFPLFLLAVVMTITLLFGGALSIPARLLLRLLRMTVQIPLRICFRLLWAVLVKVPTAIMLKCTRKGSGSAKVAVIDVSSDNTSTPAPAATPTPAITMEQQRKQQQQQQQQQQDDMVTPRSSKNLTPLTPSAFTPNKKLTLKERRVLLIQKRKKAALEAQREKEAAAAAVAAAAGHSNKDSKISATSASMKEKMSKMKTAAMLSALIEPANGAPSCPDDEYHQQLGADCGNGRLRHSMIPT
jgi:hypothetical protein